MSPKLPSRLLLGIFGVLVCLCLAAPLLIIVPLSFTEAEEMMWPPVGFTTNWYETVLMSSGWRERVVSSLEIGLGSAVLATTFGLLAALGLVRGSFPGKRIVSALLLSPLIVPTVVIAIGMFFVWDFWLVDRAGHVGRRSGRDRVRTNLGACCYESAISHYHDKFCPRYS